MLKQLFDICIDNDFDDVKLDGGGLTCNIRSFDSRYRLEAVEKNGSLELALSDRAPLAAAPEVLTFFARHGEPCYPLLRKIRSRSKIQDALDDLQSAADDLFDLARDLAEERHTPDSADAALACNFSLRDTPLEYSQLDSLFAGTMRDRRTLWYPSAGNDLRDLVAWGFDRSTELFVHTDRVPGFDLDAPDPVYEDAHNRATLRFGKEFDRLTVPDARDENAGRVLLYRAEIVSERFGKSEKPLINVVCGDAWFAAEFLVPNRIAVETILDLRGGAGAWLIPALKILHTNHFITAAPPKTGAGDDVLRKYPQLAGVPATLVPEKPRSGLTDATVYGVR